MYYSEGEEVHRSTLDYTAPEVIHTFHQEKKGPLAAFSMDMYSLGRIIMWLSTRYGNLWPHMDDPTDDDKQQFLLTDEEFALDGIVHEATRNIVHRLIS